MPLKWTLLACEHQSSSSWCMFHCISSFWPHCLPSSSLSSSSPSFPLSQISQTPNPTSHPIHTQSDKTMKSKQSCTDPAFDTPFCTHFCTTPGTHNDGAADVLECPSFEGRFYCGLGNASTCNTEHTFVLPNGYFADFRNKSKPASGSKHGATVTITEAAQASCTGKGRSGEGSGKGRKSHKNEGAAGAATTEAAVGGAANSTSVLQSYAPTGSTTAAAKSSAQAFNGTSGAEGVRVGMVRREMGLLLLGGLVGLL